MRQATSIARFAGLAREILLAAAAWTAPASSLAQGASSATSEGSAEPAPQPPSTAPRRAADGFEDPYFEHPVLPTPRIADAFRFRLESRFLPGGSFDSLSTDLSRPELGLRTTVPFSKRAVGQLTARFRSNLYGLEDASELTAGAGGVDDLFATSLIFQLGLRLNDDASLVGGGIWSLLAAGGVASRWEPGAFDEAFGGGGSLALAYEKPDALQIALGFQVESRLERGGVRWQPYALLRWNVNDRVTVRSREVGLEVEYALSPRLEVFAASFFDRDRFRLERRAGLPDDLTFRDQYVVVGLGLQWKLSRHFRLNAEGGAVAWRELRVKSHERGRLFEESADPGAYFALRLELRP